MAKFNYIQNNFTNGELDRRLDGRVDIQQYFSGADTIQNMFTLPTGGVRKRPGTRYISTPVPNVGVNTDFTVMIPFIFSKEDAKILIINTEGTADTHYYYIVNQDGTQVDIDIEQDPDTSAIFGSINPGASDLALDPYGFHWAQSGDVLFITHNSGILEPIVVFRTATDTYKLRRFRFLIDADELLQVNEAIGLGDPVDYTKKNPVLLNPYLPKNANGNIIVRQVFFGPALALEATDSTGSIGFFVAPSGNNENHKNALFKVNYFTGTVFETAVVRVYGFANIQGNGNYHTALVEVVQDYDTTTYAAVAALGNPAKETDNWQEGAWSGFRGFPRTVTLFEQRSVWGGNENRPDTVWGSLAGNFFHMMEGRLEQDTGTDDKTGLNYIGDPTDLDPFQLTPSAQEVNSIQWLSGSQSLEIGTLGQEFTATGGANNILSSGSVSFVPQTSDGSSPVRPARAGRGTYFVSRDGQAIRKFVFDGASEIFDAKDQSVLNQDIVFHGFDNTGTYSGTEFKQLAYQKSRDILWLVTSRNALVGVTLAEEQGVLAWHRHIIGGSFSSDITKILSVAVIPNPDGSHDDVWILAKRTINGSTTHYMEKMGGDFEHPSLANTSTSDDDHPWYSDSAIRYSGASTSTITGLSHLEGETVRVLADGFMQTDKTVTGGQITLDKAAEEAMVGLNYTPLLKTMRIEAGGEFGTAQAQIKRIDEITLRLYKSYDLKYGRDTADLIRINFRPGNLGMGSALPMFTGDKKVKFQSGHDEDGYVIVSQDDPLPLTLVSIIFRGVGYD